MKVVNTRIIISVIFTLILLSCNTSKLPLSFSIKEFPVPPGTIKISNNLFSDYEEVTNLNYREFLFWNERHFGKNSIEYRSVLPDTNVWSRLHSGYASLDTFYLRHPAYNRFPVVGISFEQAISFSAWRSDRVMENILIMNKVIPYRPNAPKDSLFSIEKYFNGKYYGFQPLSKKMLYPHYTLPDTSDYRKISVFADSLNAKLYKFCRKKYCDSKLLVVGNCFENIVYKTETKPYGISPTLNTYCVFCRKDLITHLNGNVREMTNIKGLFFGNSFFDSCNPSNNICREDSSIINSYSGFRNICVFKEWGNK